MTTKQMSASEQQDRLAAVVAMDRAAEQFQAAVDDQAFATQAKDHTSDCWGTAAVNWRVLAARAEAAAKACEAMRCWV